jgi:anti-sigma factor RsiW
MNCNRCEKAGAYLDGALSSAERDAFKVHLESCTECSAEVSRLQRLSKFISSADAPQAGDLVRKFRQGRSSQKRLVRIAAILTAAAAVVVVAAGVSFVLNPADVTPATMSWQHAAVAQQIDSPPQQDTDDPIAQAILQEKP